jgi:CRP-like cAMP-binding protein
MKRESPEQLERRAKAALRAGNLELALHCLGELGAARPDDPAWPRRQAELYRKSGQRDQELEALLRTSRLEAEAGEVLKAIASCNRILAIDPDHSEASDRLHLLYAIPQDGPSESSAAGVGDPEIAIPSEALAVSEEAPLEEIVLTEVVPGAHPVRLAESCDDGVMEIPLDRAGQTQELDLDLEAVELSESPPALLDATGAQSAISEKVWESALFTSLGPEVLHRLVREVEILDLPAGAVIFRQGDPPDRLYVVVDGAVVPIAEGVERTRMGVLESGSFFGEIGLIANQPRNATIEAIVDTRLLAIDRPVMWRLLREHGKMLGVLLRTLRERLIDRLVRTSPFFLAFARASRPALAKHFRLLEVREGNRVIEQGLTDPELFVVLAGELDVIQSGVDGRKVLGTLGPGDLCGEMALLCRQPAVASVVARSKCWLFSLSQTRFDRIAARNPRLLDITRLLAGQRDGRNQEACHREEGPGHTRHDLRRRP